MGSDIGPSKKILVFSTKHSFSFLYSKNLVYVPRSVKTITWTFGAAISFSFGSY